MTRGDVVWVRLPKPLGVPGREQHGLRPAVVVQGDADFGRSPTIVVVPLTTKKGALVYPCAFVISPSPQNGLAEESVAMTFQIRALDRSRVDRKVGHLSEADAARLKDELRRLLDL